MVEHFTALLDVALHVSTRRHFSDKEKMLATVARCIHFHHVIGSASYFDSAFIVEHFTALLDVALHVSTRRHFSD